MDKDYANEFFHRFCPQCGTPLYRRRKGRGRQRKFCSDECRLKWHHSHPRVKNWKKKRIAICPECGKTFLAIREYGVLRKYCSHACANSARARLKKESEHDEKVLHTEGSGGDLSGDP